MSSLRKKGVKLTPQRLAIIDILSCDRSHPGARTVFLKARESIPDISMSTVYYTLNLLKEEGLIKELEFYEQENRYESNMTDHVDLICAECGKIENFGGDISPPKFSIEASTGFKAHKMRFEYYGLCKECSRKTDMQSIKQKGGNDGEEETDK